MEIDGGEGSRVPVRRMGYSPEEAGPAGLACAREEERKRKRKACWKRKKRLEGKKKMERPLGILKIIEHNF